MHSTCILTYVYAGVYTKLYKNSFMLINDHEKMLPVYKLMKCGKFNMKNSPLMKKKIFSLFPMIPAMHCEVLISLFTDLAD